MKYLAQAVGFAEKVGNLRLMNLSAKAMLSSTQYPLHQ